ncbi:MAG TPA: biopolymer transporter ExbD [Gemmataceae bacterium]|jgi:biopolymer transport protein ExbD|nr:biopolymer transporter ExbD [Gemmataceae bacterium]
MTYSVRHAGSPKWVSDQSAADLVTGLREGRWEPTDEIWGEGEDGWVSIEDHPQFAETAAEINPPPRKHHPDETRLDMNPLIDVALVLLIFFILTTTYETIRKVLDLPGVSAKVPGQIRKVSEEAKKFFLVVTVRQEGAEPVIQVEKQTVRLEDLDAALQRNVADSKKTTMLLDASPNVDYGVVMSVIDAARGAGVTKTMWLEPPPEKK